MKRLFTLGVTSLLIAGCGTTYKNTDAAQVEHANTTLAQASSTISDSLTASEEIQRATTPPLSMKTLPDANSYNMNALASVDWSGPIGPIVKKIAQAGNYQLRVLGSKPPIPVLISIHQKNTPLAYILRDIDYQAGSKANIVVFPDTRIIELRYGRS
ncbi:MAG TPA: type IVB secretion system lipoprotein DotD [Gammaproteobacteria bacterium]|nr:type IVB secretion system lipoprotein DotD [Gammaproteobacteria bacterium]